ncbi:Aminodeoxychorismate synthase component 1 [Phycisphaerae bacterium RAS1]|nr:Aminodeoxychorismate synthase component 1 [Phycisphaerae bacterium RAS1]
MEPSPKRKRVGIPGVGGPRRNTRALALGAPIAAPPNCHEPARSRLSSTLVIPTWQTRSTIWPADVAAAARAYIGGDDCLWLDSSDVQVAPQDARFSFIAARSRATIAQRSGAPALLTLDNRALDSDADFWRLWRRSAERLPRWPALLWPLAPGWGGWLAFELAGQLEHLPQSHPAPLGLPSARIGFFDRGILLEHRSRRAIAIAAPGATAALAGETHAALDRESANHDWIQRWEDACRDAQAAPVRSETRFAAELRLSETMARNDYERMIRCALDYIAAGDIYQVNLARCVRLDGLPPAMDVFAALRGRNPAGYGAFIRSGAEAIASVSPELFLRLRGCDVLTRPIKGTRPRTGDEALDAARQAELLACGKDAAELAMIVDLHRNDLGRVCEFGSVRVASARRLEVHPTVFHTVADVAGRLAPNRTPLELLMACFPAGSVTGVPKIRAMQIIDELEPLGRGVYTGALGLLTLDGQLTMNVAIRTLQMHGDRGVLHVGGGIVAESDPAAEYEETLAKGRGILDALGLASGALSATCRA